VKPVKKSISIRGTIFTMKVLGFGAVLWDEIDNNLNIGGAVFNLAAHLRRLGSESGFITAIGSDELGRETLRIMQEQGVDTSFIQVVDTQTCVVKVSLGAAGIPAYSIPNFTSWDMIDVDERTLSGVNEACYDYFCFGTIEQRNIVSRNSLQALLHRCSFGHVFLDLNLRLHYFNDAVLRDSLQECDLLKLNHEEAARVAGTFGFNGSYGSLAQSLHEAFGIDLICITEGERGAFLWSAEGSAYCRGHRVDVVDTVGAGDAFSAGLLHGHHNGLPLSEMGDFACRLGALVASKRGAIPRYDGNDIDMLE
jgi:fructokinase